MTAAGQSPSAAPLSKPFEQLRKGDHFVTRGRTITEADVVAFAGVTGDLHPQHVDATWAASSKFGERIAHGMLTLSCALGLIPLDSPYALAFSRLSDVTFIRPVRFGDTIRVNARIRSLTAIDSDTGVVGLTLRVLNQDDRMVCRARAESQWARDDGRKAGTV